MEQAKALEILKSGKNVFLTGSAGTGKTHLLNEYISYLKKHKLKVATTASTGIAATHMNGQTIHSWCGIGINDSLKTSDLKKQKEKKYVVKNVEAAHTLIIDEISMLHQKQFELVNKVLKYLRESNEPFGGLQVIASGDFFQLPPVSKENEPSKEKFCFMAPAWVEADFTVCYLTKQFRQKANSLSKILDEFRAQKVSDESRKLLHEARNNKPEGEVTKLYTHNIDVDRINEEEFKKLKGQARVFKAKTKGNEKLRELLTKSVMAPEDLKLKKDTKVMFVKNNSEEGYVNGTLGKVFDFWENEDGKKLPLVKTNSGRNIFVKPEIWPMEDEKGKTLASFEQLPLRLAWAITVHKSQGMTLDAAEIDLTKTFEVGQGYVALSRVKEIEGLKLLGFNTTSMQVDSLAFKADQRFQQLSKRAEQIFEEKELAQLAKEFIKNNNGILKPLTPKGNTNKKAAKTTKINTYEKTHELLEEGLSLNEIAKERGLTEQTVLRHFLVIQMEVPDYDFSRVKPSDELIKQVQEGLEKAKKTEEELYSQNGHIKLAPIHKALKGKLDYRDIELGLLFCEK